MEKSSFVFSEKLKSQIDSHTVISFDIFDTLVYRNVLTPDVIFDIVESTYNSRHEESMRLSNFKDARIAAEARTRSEKQAEVSLDEIYQNLDLSLQCSEEIKDIEVNTELAFIVPNPQMKAVFNYAKDKGKIIIAISDMYLPKSFIIMILKRCGYTELTDVFVSSETGKRKRTGELYQHVISAISVLPKNILHIGDNKRSDYNKARKNGLDAYLVRRKSDINYHLRSSGFDTKKVQNNVAAALIRNYEAHEWPVERILGYSVLGFPMVGFCQWVHRNAKGKERFFLARDGHLILQSFNMLFPDSREHNHYLYISRKALRRPILFKGITYSNFVEQFPLVKTYDVKLFCELCDVDNNDINYYLNRYKDLKCVNSRIDLMHDGSYQKLFEEIRVREERKYYEQYENLTTYLRQEGFQENPIVIDVGWRGSAQRNLLMLMGEKTNIEGFYFGVEKSSADGHDNSSLHGYFFDIEKNAIVKKCFLGGRKGVFEVMFLSDQGSTSGYKKINNIIIPVLEQRGNQQEVVHNLQEGCLDFIRDYMQYIDFLPTIQADDACKALVDFLYFPEYKELRFGDAVCENLRVSYVAKPKSIKHYLFHPQHFITDLKDAEWKTGFAARLFRLNRTELRLINRLYEAVRTS